MSGGVDVIYIDDSNDDKGDVDDIDWDKDRDE